MKAIRTGIKKILAPLLNRLGWNSTDIRKRILTRILTIMIPASAILLYGAIVIGLHARNASKAIDVTIPSALAYIQLERSVMNVQKWITYICATRNEKGFDDGAQKAAEHKGQAGKDIEHLLLIFKDNPAEVKKLRELEQALKEYYEVGTEVAKAYVEGGTFFGNAMLNVFSIVETALNTALRKYTAEHTDNTLKTTREFAEVLRNTTIMFIVLVFLFGGLAVVGYLFMMKKEQLDRSNGELQAAMEELTSMNDNLNSAFAELEESNEKLIKTRDALWGEMQLAKKIQQVLLPRRPAIPGYEISAFLKPADQVGGDYYDIINVDDINWIIIGDVSGHGVPAGLVMMMAQTAIHTVLAEKSVQSPAKLLTIVNRIITENIKHLGESKYMTIVVLAAFKDGQITFSGLHRDILVYREKTRLVEHVGTRGMWIGLEDDITDMLYSDSITINIGDSILLYTDGLIEAFNERGEMFGVKSLATIFSKHGQSSTDDLKQAILTSIEPFDQDDDITLVVLRRLI